MPSPAASTRRQPAAPRRALTDADRDAAHTAATAGPASRRARVAEIRGALPQLKREREALAAIKARRRPARTA